MLPRIQAIPNATGRRIATWLATALLLPFLWLSAWEAVAQSMQERDGVTLYWGLVPGAVFTDKHALDEMHRKDGQGEPHHLVVALFDTATGKRIGTAAVRAQLIEVGISETPAKALAPMEINGLMSYGQLFSMVKKGPYRFRIFVKLPDREEEIEYPISAASPHPGQN